MTGLPWDASYHDGPAPWDIGQPQPAIVRLASKGGFAGAVLDAGCGTGENALLVASLGLSFDCREPRRCAVVVVSRLDPVRFDGGDIPSMDGVERRSQLFLTDGVRASIGTIVTEAQHIQGSIAFGHRRQTRHVSWSLVAVKGVEQSAVQNRLKPAPQTLQLERVSRSELNLDPTVSGFLSGNRQCCLSHVNAQNRI